MKTESHLHFNVKATIRGLKQFFVVPVEYVMHE